MSECRTLLAVLVAFASVWPVTATEPAVALPDGAIACLGQARLRHADRITGVAFTPDGKQVITSGADGTVRVWSVETGMQLRLLEKPGQSVLSLKLTQDGKRVAVVFNRDGTIRLLDPTTLQEVGSIPLVARAGIAFSADGALVATTDPTRKLVVTEVGRNLPKLELTNASQFDLRPDGKEIAVADPNGTVTIYRTTGGKPVFTAKHDGVSVGLMYSPDGERLAVGIRVRDGTHTLRIYEPGRQPKSVAEVPAMSVPGRWLGRNRLACSNDQEGGVYDLAKKQWVSHVKGVRGAIAVSPDGSKLAATGHGVHLRLWDLANGKQLHARDDTFPDPALLAASHDGRALFLISGDTAYHWSIGERRAKSVGRLPGVAVAAALGGDRLVVATPNAVLLYEDFDPTKPLPQQPTRSYKNSAHAQAVAISANGSHVAWAFADGKVVATDVSDTRMRRTLPVTTATIFALTFNRTGDRLAVLGRDPFLRVWDVSRDEPKEAWKARITRGVQGAVAFSPDGKRVVASSTSQLVVFDATESNDHDKEQIRDPLSRYPRYSDNGDVRQAVFTPDSRTLIVGTSGQNGRVEVWEMKSRKLIRIFHTGFGGISRLCVFPDGKRAASAGAEEAVTVWDLTARAR